MKIIGVAASPRKNKSTNFLLEQCLDEANKTAQESGIHLDTELVDLAGMKINGCISCDACRKGLLCSQQDDFQSLIGTFADPEVVGIIMATPVYMGSMTSQAKAFIDRSVLYRRNGFMFRDKLGGVLTVGGSRNGGQELTIQAVHAAMMIHGMIVVGDGEHFGGTAWGNHPGGHEGDATGIATARKLGKRITEVASKFQS
ncbi:flavodoxin family protein [Desulfosediminicola flagellatus]|uniref:flavodoxin family protein n=1 Tax=Desulfosediminicola flagellatus TaxID=2569541 RepID=UPI0010AD03BE|nr:flavodoxin family protein [Desulfosediminicola flagellatus]